MAFELHINSDSIVHFTNALERIRTSALPNAVRNTLNNAAFEVKMKTMPEASNTFTHRQANFFRANSKVLMAQGNNINAMASMVGFYENRLANQGRNYAVQDLENQEQGGGINKKSFIPLNNARRGGVNTGMVKPNARLSKIPRIYDAKNSRGANDKERAIRAAFAAGKGGFVLAGNILWQITALKKGKRTQIKRVPLYSFRHGRSVNVRARHFMENASVKIAKKMELFFIRNAEKELARIRV